jgi:hypothetical protein
MENIKEKIKKDEEKGKEKRSVRLEKVDGKIISSFNIETEKEGNNYEYNNYTKIFDDFTKFSEYTDKFFNL